MATFYPHNVKESIIKQILNNSCTIASIAKQAGIPYTTVLTWKKQYLQGDNMKTKKLSAQDKLDCLFQTASMSEAEISEFCRSKGIYPHMLEQWKQTCLNSFQGSIINPKELKKEKKRLKAKVSQLQKEIRRKDKTIAETTALLVLKKKLQELWQDQEDEK